VHHGRCKIAVKTALKKFSVYGIHTVVAINQEELFAFLPKNIFAVL